ncbi:MAG: hypothetical protein IPP68_03600 [Elusimicrobia bacterium]|nr:hypothetical protein [Elusimicrobiota bacterium]
MESPAPAFLRPLSVLALFLWGTATPAEALTTRDYAVQVTARRTGPRQITLSWPTPTAAPGSYNVRRQTSGTGRGPSIATLAGSATQFVDDNAPEGTVYDYTIETDLYNRYGEARAGFDLPPVEHRGTVLLVVDQTQASPLSSELARLEEDLIGDGWKVIRHDVPRDDAFASSGALQRQVKALIVEDYTADPSHVKEVFLFGRAPIPYAGAINPDGHSNHLGAWPADVYYGDVDGLWTDATANYVQPGNARLTNRPGDGKFDQTIVPADGSGDAVELGVGRVDLSNLPAFPHTETELLRGYLNKDHDYRHHRGVFAAVPQRGLIRDGFGVFGGEAFAANGWRNFTALLGTASITAVGTDQYFPTLASDAYLWTYACGGGTYQSASGVGTTTAGFAVGDPKTVFTLLFGSYFGDWDNANNFLRAPLATPSYGLASAWPGRPNWQFHAMSLGETLGESARFSQNAPDVGHGQIHVALLGDPTLRANTVAPPADAGGDRSDGRWSVTWTPSSDAAVSGYAVFRGDTPRGPFARLTPEGGTAAHRWRDNGAQAGHTYTYMVRALKLETTPTGSYTNLSQGVFATLTVPGEPRNVADAFPNPWRGGDHGGLPMLFRNVPDRSVIRVYGVSGNRVREIRVEGGPAQWDLLGDDGRPVGSGVYYFVVEAGGEIQRGRLAVQR